MRKLLAEQAKHLDSIHEVAKVMEAAADAEEAALAPTPTMSRLALMARIRPSSLLKVKSSKELLRWTVQRRILSMAARSRKQSQTPWLQVL